MDYQQQKSPLTRAKYAAYNLLLNNTAAGANVFKNRPVPVWPIHLQPSGAICLYFLQGKGDTVEQDFPKFYNNECLLVAECLAQAAEPAEVGLAPSCDDLVELLAKEVFDILTANIYLPCPALKLSRTVDNLIYSHFEMELKATSDDILASYCLYFKVTLQEEIGTRSDLVVQPFRTAHADINTVEGAHAENTFPIQQ